jgi:uncharacterized protein
MSFPKSFGSVVSAILLLGLAIGSGGCRKKDEEAASKASPPSKDLAPELLKNGLGALPGAVYRSQTQSPIHWQPWTKESMDLGKKTNRLIFAVVAMPQQPGFQSILTKLASDPERVDIINESYVPVLIDGDAAREIGLLTAVLCAEIKRSLQLPLFIWMTAEGNPVAWIPVDNQNDNSVGDLFDQSHSMVSRMWEDGADYVLKNSALDNANRQKRIGERANASVMSEQPKEDVVRSLRQLASYYDVYSRSFDEAGGLFPAGAIDLLSTAAVHPGLHSETRNRSLETVRELLLDLLPSAMFDPLEGGVFSARRGSSWALPAFYRDCTSQGRAAVALINAYRATNNPIALEKALGVITYAEKNFVTSEALFAIGMANESDPADWLWSIEEVKKELSPEDAEWWIGVTGMKGLGNLPFEADPRREYFRANSLGLGKSMQEMAEALSTPVEAFTARFEMVRKTLLKARNTRLGALASDETSHAGATFRMVSAYAAAFGVTGDEQFREKAVRLLERARIAFSDGPKLRLFSKDSPPSIGEARAFLYGLALQAALDVSAISSDEKWLDWAENLATTAAELFTASDFLKECPEDAKIIDLPITDLVMLFDDSTAGLISFAECRFSDLERPLVNSFSKLATPLPISSVERPILHTDLLQANLAREYRVDLIMGTELSPELKLAAERLPMRMFQRRVAKTEDEVPPDSMKIKTADGDSHLVSTVEALHKAVLPKPGL